MIAAHALYYDEYGPHMHVCACGWHVPDELEEEYLDGDVKKSTEAHADHVAAALRESRTVRAPLDLALMPDGTVIVGPDGKVGEKRDWPLDLAVNYLDGTTRTNSNIPLPARVLYVPGEPGEDGAL